MTAGRRAKRHIANFDVQHHLQVLDAECLGGINDLHAGLRCESEIFRIDGYDLVHPGHVQDGAAIGRRTGREGVIIPHCANRSGKPRGVSHNGLYVLCSFGISELLGSGSDASVVIHDLSRHRQPRGGLYLTPAEHSVPGPIEGPGRNLACKVEAPPLILVL